MDRFEINYLVFQIVSVTVTERIISLFVLLNCALLVKYENRFIIVIVSSITVFAGVLFCASAGRKPCTWSISHSSQSFCLYTKHLPEDSRRSQHADLLNLGHSSSL